MADENILSQSTLKTQVYHYLRNQIFTGELPAEKRLIIPDIAEKLKVSLTPVREAISQLTVEGYVTTIPRRGSFVRKLNHQEFLDTYEVLGVLDSYAARIVADRISDEALDELEQLTLQILENDSLDQYVENNWNIHGLIARESGNKVLLDVTNRLREEVIRYRYVSLCVDKRMGRSRDEHRQILEALKNRDREAASRIMEEHRKNTFGAIQQYLKSIE